jgi:small-conductance mechanosensitive channel
VRLSTTFAVADVEHWLSQHLGGILAGIAALVALWVVDRILARKGRQWAERLPHAEQAVLETRYRMLRRIVVAVLLFIAIAGLLLYFPATQTYAQTALASSAVLGLAIGFAARSTLANFVAGIMIAINQPVRLGDRVSVGADEGIVEDVGLTYTRIRTADNRRVLIPNEELANSRVTNLTLVDPVSLAQVRVTVPMGADPARVREILSDLVPLTPGRIGDRPDPGVSVAELTADGVVFTLGVWTPDATHAAQASAWLRERALARLSDEGVFRDTPAVAQ